MQEIESLSPDRLNITFDQPKRIIFGVNSANEIGKELNKLGTHNVLLLTDVNIVKTGLSDRIQKILEDSMLSVKVYDKISAEPTMESVENAVKAAREYEGLQAVVGLGGG